MSASIRAMATVGVLALLAGSAVAKDVFVSAPLSDITEGEQPGFAWSWVSASPLKVALKGPGEAYVLVAMPSRDAAPQRDRYPVPEFDVVARIPEGSALAGSIVPPDEMRYAKTKSIAFAIAAAQLKQGAEGRFLLAREQYYSGLAGDEIPGAAWFRHQAAAAHAARLKLKDKKTTETVDRFAEMRRRRPSHQELIETYDILSGGRAISENLRLDRELMVAASGETMLPLAGVQGITVRPYDWSAVSTGTTPALDPLAAAIPEDQHAIFFPSFQAMVDVMDEADRNGTPILDLIEPRSEDARTRERYQKQLCLATDVFSRMLGPKLVKSVAFTGSDPYLRTGTDVAVIFEAVDGPTLASLIAARQAAQAASTAAAQPVGGEMEAVKYQGFRSPDRAVCTYLAVSGNTVVVTNSPYQLGRILKAVQGKTPPLAQSKDYRFFRTRYARGAEESALVVLSDATIRRWCGPAWRIGASRRVRMASVMAELQARRLERLTAGDTSTENLAKGLEGVADIGWTDAGPLSAKYGSLVFQTPIAELNVDSATQAEIDAYGRFRSTYEMEWSRYFDPIAARLATAPARLAADLTVMPLQLGSDYREFSELTRGARIKPGAGDPHPQSLLHFVLAINHQSRSIKEFGGMFSSHSGMKLADPLGWLGFSIAVYLDDDPFWQDLAKAVEKSQAKSDDEDEDQDAEDFMEHNFGRLPVAATFEVVDSLKLTAFLSALHGLADQSAPDMTHWQTLKYKNRSYVKVTGRDDDEPETGTTPWAVYYAASPKSLTVTLSESLIKRAIDRQSAKRSNRATTATAWQGDSLALTARKDALDIVTRLADDSYQKAMQARSWTNLPILNEWHALFPGEDPVAVHERLWGVRLVDPAGGRYVWNEQGRTMESTVYGSPLAPRRGKGMPAALTAATGIKMGLTFENDGVRARATLDRAVKTRP